MAQFARPSSDISTGVWTPTPLWQSIDESTFSDADFIGSDVSTNETVEVKLSTVLTPAAGTVTIRYRYAKDATGGNSRDITVALVQGTTVLATGTARTPTATSFTADSFTVASSAITDPTDLRLRFTAGGTTGGSPGNRRAVRVSWAEVELPDGVASFSRVVGASAAIQVKSVRTLGASAAISVSGGGGGGGAITASAETTNTNNGTLGIAASASNPGVSNDDVVLFSGVFEGGSIPTGPIGFTLLHEATTLTNPRSAVWYKRITDAASEPATYQTQSTVSVDWTARCQVLTGVDPDTPIDVAATEFNDNVTSTNTATGSITPTTDGAFVWSLCSINASSRNISDLATPWTNGIQLGPLTERRNKSAWQVVGTAAQTDAVWTFDGNALGRVVIMAAFRPAPASGATLSRTLGASAAIQTTDTRSFNAAASISGPSLRILGASASISAIETFTNTLSATAAIGNLNGVADSSLNRIVDSSANPIVTVSPTDAGSLSRLLSTSAAISTINSRSIGASATVSTVGNTRAVGASVAVSTIGNLRSLAVAAALRTTVSRALPAATAIQTTQSRALATAVSIGSWTDTRTLNASAAVRTSLTRSIGVQAAISGGSTRGLSAEAAIRTTETTDVAASAAIQTTQARTLSPSAAVSVSLSRTLSANAALSSTEVNSLGAVAAVSESFTRTLGVTAAISGAVTRAIAASVSVGNQSAVVDIASNRIVTSTADPIVTVHPLDEGVVTRTLVASAAIRTIETNALGTMAAIQTTQARILDASAAIRETFIRTLSASAAVSDGSNLVNARTAYKNGTTSGWAARSAHLVGGSLYIVYLDTATSKIRITKGIGADVGVEQDATHAPTHSGATHSYDSYAHGTNIYVFRRSTTNTGRVRVFDTTTDTWASTDVGNADVATSIAEDRGVSLIVRSDGDVVVIYSDPATSDMKFAVYEGSGWTTTVLQDLIVQMFPGSSVINGTDAIRAVYGSTIAKHLSITSANVGSQDNVDTSALTLFASFPGAVNDGGTYRVAYIARDATGELDFYFDTFTDTLPFGPPPSTNGLSASATTDGGVMGGVVVPYNNQWYVIWSGNGRGAIHYDVSDDLATPTFGVDQTLVSDLVGTDPGVYALATPNGIPVVYTDHGTTSVKVVWAAGGPGGLTRSVTSSAAIRTTNTRPFGASAAIRTTDQRALLAHAAVRTTETRALSASAAIRTAQTRTLAASTAISDTFRRSLGSSAALSETHTRTLSAGSTVQTTETRVLGASAAISLNLGASQRFGGLMRTQPAEPIVLSRVSGGGDLSATRQESADPLAATRTHGNDAVLAVTQQASTEPIALTRQASTEPLALTRTSTADPFSATRSEVDL